MPGAGCGLVKVTAYSVQRTAYSVRRTAYYAARCPLSDERFPLPAARCSPPAARRALVFLKAFVGANRSTRPQPRHTRARKEFPSVTNGRFSELKTMYDIEL